MFDYADGDNRWKGAARPGPVADDAIGVRPVELAASEHFSRRGEIEDWTDPDQTLLGDFPPAYRRPASENPATRDLLEHIACWWLKETDADGLRIDAIRHMHPVFVTSLCDTASTVAKTGRCTVKRPPMHWRRACCVRPSGPHAHDLIEFIDAVDGKLTDKQRSAPKISLNDQELRRMLAKRAKTLRLGVANYCWLSKILDNQQYGEERVMPSWAGPVVAR